MLADELDYVLGVDTHRDEHALVAVAAPVGAVVRARCDSEGSRGPAGVPPLALREVPRLARGRMQLPGRFNLTRSRRNTAETASKAGSNSDHFTGSDVSLAV